MRKEGKLRHVGFSMRQGPSGDGALEEIDGGTLVFSAGGDDSAGRKAPLSRGISDAEFFGRPLIAVSASEAATVIGSPSLYAAQHWWL